MTIRFKPKGITIEFKQKDMTLGFRVSLSNIKDTTFGLRDTNAYIKAKWVDDWIRSNPYEIHRTLFMEFLSNIHIVIFLYNWWIRKIQKYLGFDFIHV